jgi:AdoMet-dependent heme synthase
MASAHTGAADLLAARAARSRVPIAVTFQVTDRCNYECTHCYQEHGVKPELSTDEVVRIFREIADAGTLFLVLMGGEFFMRRDADHLLQVAHDLGFAIRLKTTGHHVTDKRADFLATVRPLEIDLSLYGADRHAHEDVTHHQGSFDRTLAAARRLIARRIPVVIRCPVMQGNADQIRAVEALGGELGAEVSFDPKILAREDADLAPTTLRMNAVTLRTFYRASMGAFLEREFDGFDAATKTRHGHEVNALGSAPCGAGERGVSIDAQGLVWPCNILPVPAGDLRRQSFHEVWSGSDALADVRKVTWAMLSECNVCEVRAYCSRCHAMAQVEHGTMYGPSLEACRHAVEVRDALRERGVIPATETALPPTWSRIDPDGQHEPRDGKRRPRLLRVLPSI